MPGKPNKGGFGHQKRENRTIPMPGKLNKGGFGHRKRENRTIPMPGKPKRVISGIKKAKVCKFRCSADVVVIGAVISGLMNTRSL